MATTTAATRRTTKKPQTAPPPSHVPGRRRPRRRAAPGTGSGRRARAAPERGDRRRADRARAVRRAQHAGGQSARRHPAQGGARRGVDAAHPPRAAAARWSRGSTQSSWASCAQSRPGRSALAPAGGDRRFADAAWSDSAGFRRLLQAYVALGQTLDAASTTRSSTRPTPSARASSSRCCVDAIAPTNFIVTNPAALKKLVDTKGASVIRGLANLVEDLTSGTLPAEAGRRPAVHGRHEPGRRRRARSCSATKCWS